MRKTEEKKETWEDNIIMYGKEIGQKGAYWFHLAQARLTVTGFNQHGNEPSVYLKCREFHY
jgi:hypothetical protein